MLSHARTQAQIRGQCLCLCQLAEASQPKWVRMQGRAGGSHLQRQAQRAVPEELRKHAPGAADAEEDRVVVVLLEAIVPAGGDGGGGGSWRGMAAAAPAVRCARRGLSGGVHGGSRRRRGVDCLTPRGEREAVFGRARARCVQ